MKSIRIRYWETHYIILDNASFMRGVHQVSIIVRGTMKNARVLCYRKTNGTYQRAKYLLNERFEGVL